MVGAGAHLVADRAGPGPRPAAPLRGVRRRPALPHAHRRVRHDADPAYPKGFFGDRPGALGTDAEEAEEVGRVTENLGASGSATRPLVLGTPATVLLVVFLLAGLAGGASGSTSSYTTGDEPEREPSPSPAVTDR